MPIYRVFFVLLVLLVLLDNSSDDFLLLGPEPAFGRLGLGGSLGGHSSHGFTSHASLRAYGAQLGGDRLVFKRPTKDGEDLLLD